MRIARLKNEGVSEFAVSTTGDAWVPLSRLGLDHPDTAALIVDRETVRSAAERYSGETVSIAEDRLLSPIVRPGKILAVGLNYASHAKETGATPPERPLIFAKYTNSLNSPFGEVAIGKHVTEQADYEVELGVVIGKTAKGVTEDSALDHVFGYVVANDVSARDWQRSDSQFSRSKSADTFCPVGPWITTADEIPNAEALELRSRVNGEDRQSGSTADMIFDVPALIAYLSATITLEPGDLILTGTPPGVGLGFTPPRFLKPGDIVECSIEGLGSIRNRFVDA